MKLGAVRGEPFRHRVTSLALVFITMDMLLTVVVCFTLVIKLRKADDIFYMAAEMRMFGVVAFGNLCEECACNAAAYTREMTCGYIRHTKHHATWIVLCVP